MILYGTNPIAWTNDDDRSLGAHISLEQCLDEAAEIGFDGIEKGHKMPLTADGLNALLAKKHMARVGHIHAKNVRPDIAQQMREQGLSLLEGVRRGAFTVPGDADGAVDFFGVLEVAAQHNYSGWLVIEAEQAPSVRVPLDYQSLGLRSLKGFAKRAGLDR